MCHQFSKCSHWLSALPSHTSFCCMGMAQAMCFHDALPHGHWVWSLCRNLVQPQALSCCIWMLAHWLPHKLLIGAENEHIKSSRLLVVYKTKDPLWQWGQIGLHSKSCGRAITDLNAFPPDSDSNLQIYRQRIIPKLNELPFKSRNKRFLKFQFKSLSLFLSLSVFFCHSVYMFVCTFIFSAIDQTNLSFLYVTQSPHPFRGWCCCCWYKQHDQSNLDMKGFLWVPH